VNLLNRFSLKTKVLLIVGLACVICMAIAVGVARHFIGESLHTSIVSKSRTIHSRLSAATDYVAQQGGLRASIERMTSKHSDPSALTQEDKLEVLKQVPIFAAMQIGAKNAEQENYKFRVFSDEPRNKDNLATPEEMAIFKQFQADTKLPEVVVENADWIAVYRPVRLSEAQGCLYCHGHPSSSPWKNGKDVLGYPMEDWKDGKLHGVFAVTTRLDDVKAVQAKTDKLVIALISIGAVLALILASLALRGTLSAIQNVITILENSNKLVGSTTENVRDLASRLSDASTKQAASLEETVSALNETSSMVSKNSDNPVRASKTSIESNQRAESGKKVVEQMVASMDEINASNQEIQDEISRSNAQISDIVKVIEEIGTKTKVINDIVFQTKLLSFNASVEAARAGEHGKGFAVVAEEVGNLAQMSGNASKEISALLERSNARVAEIVETTKTNVGKLIESGKSKVDSGSRIANECRETLEDIMRNSGQVSQMVAEISAASQEQDRGIEEINKAMNLLNQVTQENAVISDRTAGVSQDLSDQAKNLQSAVQRLISTVNGDSVENSTSPAPRSSTPVSSRSPRVVEFKNKKKSNDQQVPTPSSDDERFTG